MNAQKLLTDPAPHDSTLRQAAARQVTKVTLTSAGEKLLRRKLELLRRELDEDYPARLREARSFGEATGNDDYLQVKEEEALLVHRVYRLQAMLDAATVLRSDEADTEVVAVGSRVEVEDLDSGAVGEYRLTGGFEEAAAGVSADSPVGQALLGRRAGDQVEVELPRGRRLRLRVIAIAAAEPVALPAAA